MALAEIIEVSQRGMAGDDLFAGWIEAPVSGYETETYALTVSGWVLGRTSPVVAVELRYADMLLRTAPVEIARPDIATGYPDYPDRGRAAACGFATAIGTLGLAPEFAVHVEAVLEDGRRVPLGAVRGRHDPLRSGFVPALQPIMVTSLGRTGTTLLMQLLADHPDIVVQRLYAYETRWSTYWAHMAKVLGEPGTFMPPQQWINSFENFDAVGHNPFNFTSYTYDPLVAGWLNRDYPERLAAFCQQSAEAFYRQIAAGQGQTEPAYYAEKHFPGFIPDVIWELYPQAKEIVSVRDFRDMLCSIAAFVAKPGRTFFEYSSTQSTEELIAQMRGEVELLLRSWRRRSARAHLVRYEDLVREPTETLRGVFAYLGLEISPATLAAMVRRGFAETPDLRNHRTTASLDASIGRWRRDLSPPLLRLVEDAYGDALREFGYA